MTANVVIRIAYKESARATMLAGRVANAAEDAHGSYLRKSKKRA
jgi:hypothetical protein